MRKVSPMSPSPWGRRRGRLGDRKRGPLAAGVAVIGLDRKGFTMGFFDGGFQGHSLMARLPARRRRPRHPPLCSGFPELVAAV